MGSGATHDARWPTFRVLTKPTTVQARALALWGADKYASPPRPATAQTVLRCETFKRGKFVRIPIHREGWPFIAFAFVANLLAWLLAHWNNPTGHGAEFHALIQRRFAGEPIQYINGEQEFYGLPFLLTPDVLIPRPETEHLVEAVLARLPNDVPLQIADIGTGSGAIAIALAVHLPEAEITALDLSQEALVVAAAVLQGLAITAFLAGHRAR